MKGNVALVCEQGVRFAVVVVSPSLMSGLRCERDGAVQALSAQLLAGLCPEQLPWREFATQAA